MSGSYNLKYEVFSGYSYTCGISVFLFYNFLKFLFSFQINTIFGSHYVFFNLLRVCHRSLKVGIFLPTYLPFGLVVIKTLFITSTVHLTAGKFMAQLAYKSLQFCEFQHLLK